MWLHLWVVALCLNIIPGILFAVAETRTTSVVAGIINALTPLTTLFFMLAVFRDEPMKRFQLVGLGRRSLRRAHRARRVAGIWQEPVVGGRWRSWVP